MFISIKNGLILIKNVMNLIKYVIYSKLLFSQNPILLLKIKSLFSQNLIWTSDFQEYSLIRFKGPNHLTLTKKLCQLVFREGLAHYHSLDVISVEKPVSKGQAGVVNYLVWMCVLNDRDQCYEYLIFSYKN